MTSTLLSAIPGDIQRRTSTNVTHIIQGDQPLFDLLRLQLDIFSIHEDSLPLIRLRLPPHPYLSRKL